MKKLMMLALAAAVGMFVLAGCGGGKDTKSYTTDLVSAMAEAGAFSESLEELDGDTAFALYKLEGYGLTREDLTDCAVLRSAGATCEEGAVLVLSDSDQAAKALEAMQAYVQAQISANESYRPAEIPKLEGAIVEQRGSSVLLVVANDLDAAKSVIPE